jgi:hypothetical protein
MGAIFERRSASHGDAGGEIEELIAVDVGDDDAASALGHQRIRTGVGRRNIFLIAGEDALGVGAGQGGLELGTEGLCFASGGRGHGLGGHEVLRMSRGLLVVVRWPITLRMGAQCDQQPALAIRRIRKLVATEQAGTKTRWQDRPIAPRTHEAVEPALGQMRIGILA